MKDYNLVGDYIKDIRKGNKMSVRVLAEKTGLTIGYISNIEKNRSSPTLSTLNKICDALNIPLSEFLKI